MTNCSVCDFKKSNLFLFLLLLFFQTVGAEQVKVIQAHSLMLSLQSTVFEELLLSRNGTTLVLLETAECAAVFDNFIR